MKPKIPTPTPKVDGPTPHEENVRRILEQAFGRDLLRQVDQQGLDLQFLFGDAPKKKKKKKK